MNNVWQLALNVAFGIFAIVTFIGGFYNPSQFVPCIIFSVLFILTLSNPEKTKKK
jgi:hypothetical protein